MFINQAYAAPAAASANNGDLLGSALPMILIAIAFYFILIRPQTKRAKELKIMLDAIQKGDEVITTGGIVGKVTKLNDQFATLEISENTEIRLQKAAIQGILPKGTIKTL